MIHTIMSGGQTGADRAGLDWAIRHNVYHIGYCPLGRRSLDGRIPDRYNMIETHTHNYDYRTRMNVVESDATVIFTKYAELRQGSKLTQTFARRSKKPCFHFYPGVNVEAILPEFITHYGVTKLNVAGSRQTDDNDIYQWTIDQLECLLPLVIQHYSPTNDHSSPPSLSSESPQGDVGSTQTRSILHF